MTAIRETFEETGILLATPISPSLPPPSPSQISFARRAIHSRTDPTTFTSFLAEHNLSVTSTQKCLIPFTQWITPVAAKSRFWTWFYVAFLDEMEGVLAAGDVEIGPSSGNVLSSVLEKLAPTPVPTSDNHVEIQSAYFQSPRAIIQAFDQGDITLMPPQFYLLTMLADTLDRHRAERKKREEDRLAAGYMRDIVGRKFGGRVFNPRFGGKIIGEDGVERSVLMYEGDGRYGKGLAGDGNNNDVKESGRQDSVLAKHRSLLTFINGVRDSFYGANLYRHTLSTLPQLTDPLLPPCVSLHVFSVHELSSLKEQSIFWDWTPNPGLVDDPRSYDDDVRSSFKWKSLRLVSRGQVGYYHTLDLPSTSLDVRRRPGADPFGPVTCT
jgi:hypothetical protein